MNGELIMADVDHPKTHIEDQDNVDLPRTQPESPKHEGIDPLTESDTMYPAENQKDLATKAARSEAKAGSLQASSDAQQNTVDAQANLGSDSPALNNEPAPELREKTGDTDADNVNADGKLPADAKVANHVGSDAGNTSPSNKPKTVNEVNDPAESNSVAADQTVKAEGAKSVKPKADSSTRPTNNYPKSELK